MFIQTLLAVLVVAILVYIIYRRFVPPKGPTLYERLGGIYSISAVINHFSDNLVDNPIVGKNSENPALKEWHTNQLARLPGLKFMRSLWVAAVSGGPFRYSPTVPGRCPFSLENAHSKFKITSDEFDAVAVELTKSLDHFKVPDAEKKEVLAAFAGHKGDIDGSAPPKCPFRQFLSKFWT